MKRKMIQHWNRYTRDDHEVWEILFTRQLASLQDKACREYLECINQSALKAGEVPDFSVLSPHLNAATGWEVEVVKGIIPVTEFMELLALRRFCSSTWLRQRHQLDYLEEPDMFHDIFGHIPLFYHGEYADFACRFGQLGLRWKHDATALALLERLYWFTIEFGLIREAGEVRIYGAGLLSSFGETNYVMHDAQVKRHDFSVQAVLSMPFRNDAIQTDYFVLESWAQLWNCLPETEAFLRDVAAGKIAKESLRLHEQKGSAEMTAPAVEIAG
ncbi:MAG: phenylalanine 4-monooxygenase [Bacteroidetes bacterium]|nr:phenylalanine 4-monooxygenase [Bacteroidota bacterium]